MYMAAGGEEVTSEATQDDTHFGVWSSFHERGMFRGMPKSYTVSDGELVLILEALPEQDGGGYGVTSPLEPQLVTEAKTIEEAFAMARDAIQALRESRQRYARRIAEIAAAES